MPNLTTRTTRPSPWYEGYRARQTGQSVDSCPYAHRYRGPTDEFAYDQWVDGFNDRIADEQDRY
jgi:ribosome modulation factor